MLKDTVELTGRAVAISTIVRHALILTLDANLDMKRQINASTTSFVEFCIVSTHDELDNELREPHKTMEEWDMFEKV